MPTAPGRLPHARLTRCLGADGSGQADWAGWDTVRAAGTLLSRQSRVKAEGPGWRGSRAWTPGRPGLAGRQGQPGPSAAGSPRRRRGQRFEGVGLSSWPSWAGQCGLQPVCSPHLRSWLSQLPRLPSGAALPRPTTAQPAPQDRGRAAAASVGLGTGQEFGAGAPGSTPKGHSSPLRPASLPGPDVHSGPGLPCLRAPPRPAAARQIPFLLRSSAEPGWNFSKANSSELWFWEPRFLLSCLRQHQAGWTGPTAEPLGPHEDRPGAAARAWAERTPDVDRACCGAARGPPAPWVSTGGRGSWRQGWVRGNMGVGAPPESTSRGPRAGRGGRGLSPGGRNLLSEIGVGVGGGGGRLRGRRQLRGGGGLGPCARAHSHRRGRLLPPHDRPCGPRG